MNRTLAIVMILLAAFGGFSLRGWVTTDANAAHDDHAYDDHGHEDHEDHLHDDHEEEEPHVALTEEAFKTLALRLGPAMIEDYLKTSTIPARVVEFPGVSAYKLAAPVNGVVSAVAAEPGASVVPGDALFEVRVTDERVLDAQLDLLKSLTRREIVNEELDRLAPLTSSGAVSGRLRRDLTYERRELASTINLRRDELVVRGLTETQVEELIQTKRLLRSVIVRVPEISNSLSQGPEGAKNPAIRNVAWEKNALAEDFSVERLLIAPGQTVERGQALCDLASHARLYLQAKAFERDVPLLAKLAERGDPLSAEFGHSLDAHGPTSIIVSDLRIRYVANHVDTESQAYDCFLALENELLHESTGATGRRYRTWRFAVGQRAHLLLPTEQLHGQIPLPIDAVAIEGPNAFVFRQHEHKEPEDHDHAEHDDHANCDHEGNAHADHDHDDHDHTGHEHDDHGHEKTFLELEPVPVTLLHRGSRHVVVAANGELQAGDSIAMNAAYQLFLALKADTEGGGGHSHEH